MRLSFALFILFIATLVNAQSDNFSVSIGSSITSRILTLDKDQFSNAEVSAIRNLENFKPNYMIEVGYSFKMKEDLILRLGIGFRHTRFGTKIYTLPSEVHNPTPQYSQLKEVVRLNQIMICFMPEFRKINLLKSASLFTKAALIYNPNYTIYHPTFDKNREKGIVGVKGSYEKNIHRVDINFGLGLNYELFQKKPYQLTLQPYASIFVLPYEIDNQYLYFNKTTKGYLWDVGLMIRYEL